MVNVLISIIKSSAPKLHHWVIRCWVIIFICLVGYRIAFSVQSVINQIEPKKIAFSVQSVINQIEPKKVSRRES